MSARARLLGVLWVAGAVSIACNVLAADSTVVARFVAAWFPVALLLVVEVLARVELPGRLRWVAGGGAVAVAVPAAVASFHHMHSVALEAGEPPVTALLFPLTVDGLAVVASAALAGLHRADVAEDQAEEVPARPVTSSPPLPTPVVRSVGSGSGLGVVGVQGSRSARGKRPVRKSTIGAVEVPV